LASCICPVCKTTAVRKSGTLCASCRDRGGTIIDTVDQREFTPDPVFMTESEPLAILETQLRQARSTQAEVQAIMDTPRALLCAACLENPMAEERVAVGLALTFQQGLAKVLGLVIPQWLSLQKGAKKAAEQMDHHEFIELFADLFSRFTESLQRETLQGLTRIYNERKGTKNGQAS
jgi:hypothetical protein